MIVASSFSVKTPDLPFTSLYLLGRFETDTRHSKYVTFQLAEVAVTRDLFAAILDRIARLAIPPPPVARAYV
jgi:hypothetical protein